MRKNILKFKEKVINIMKWVRGYLIWKILKGFRKKVILFNLR